MDRFERRKQTKDRRRNQTCKVYEVKVDKSKLSKKDKASLQRLFVEAKWFYNFCLGHKDLNTVDTTVREVPVKVGDIFEIRPLTILTGQMKQGLKTRLFSSLKALHELKKKGHKVGRLRFKSEVASILLTQHKKTFFLDKEFSKVRIQNFSAWFKVRGLDQIPEDAEIADARLIRRCGDYFVHVTTYQDKEESPAKNASIGIDFGCQTQLTFSNGVKVEFAVPPSKRLRWLDRKIHKNNRQDSANKRKDQAKREKEYLWLTNRRRDIRNKLVSAIVKNYRVVCFQDESISAWQAGGHGRKINSTGIGGIIADLKHKSHTPVEVDRFFPSTQLCPRCGKKNKLSESERVYACSCGYVEDRDFKSSVCIEQEGLRYLPADRRQELGEGLSSTEFSDLLSKINSLKISKTVPMNQEATGLAPW